MHYCGLDVSRKSTHVYIEDAQGRRVTRGIVATTPTGLAGAVERYTARGVRVAIEAGNQTAWIVDLLRELGAKVHVVHPLKVKLIAESKKKTDRIDAQLLAHLLRIGGLPEPVHVPSHRSRELRGLLVARRQLVHMRTRLVNVVRGLARQQRIELRPRALRTHGGWSQLAAAELSPALREVVAAYEATVQAVGTALGALDRQLAQRARRDPRVARLETMPGVGPVCAQTLVAAVDTIDRFATREEARGLRGAGAECAGERGAGGIRPDHETGTERDSRGLGPGRARRPRRQGDGSRPTPALVDTGRPSTRQEDGDRRLSPEAADHRIPSLAGRNDVRRAATAPRRIGSRPQVSRSM